MDVAQLYLDLLKKQLTNFHHKPYSFFKPVTSDIPKGLMDELRKNASKEYYLCNKKEYNPLLRAQGRDWPDKGETMIGLLRLQNIEDCFKQVLKEGVKGDLLEAGVWRGGASIFMQALNRVLADNTRRVWVADSFEGLPKSAHPADLKYDFTQYTELAISLETVKKNFKQYQLLDDSVQFVKGWFKDTLPHIEVEAISLLRLDGDLYASTMDILQNLYHKVSIGGYIIVDDFSIDCCVEAIHDFRKAHDIQDPIHRIDWTGVYWKKS